MKTVFETEQRSGGPVTKVVNNNLNNFPIPIETPVLSQRGPRFTDVSNYGVCGLWSRVTRHMTPSWLPLLSLELAMAALFSQGWNIPPRRMLVDSQVGCEKCERSWNAQWLLGRLQLLLWLAEETTIFFTFVSTGEVFFLFVLHGFYWCSA